MNKTQVQSHNLLLRPYEIHLYPAAFLGTTPGALPDIEHLCPGGKGPAWVQLCHICVHSLGWC